jgi:hypothetical protein
MPCGVKLLALLAAIGLLAAAVPRASAVDTGYLAPAWVRTFGTAGTDEGWGVAVGPSGEVYVAGFVQGQGTDVFLARLDANGATAWETRVPQPLNQKAFEVAYADGFLYVGGATQRAFSVTSQDMLLLKAWASNGTVAWSTSWNGPADLYDEIDGIVVEDGVVYASGWTGIPLDYTRGDLALVEFTLDGLAVRNTTWGGSLREEANGALVSDGSRLYATGIVDGVNLLSGGDAVVVAFDQANLTEAWNATWGGSAVDDGYGLALHGDRLYAVGLTLSFGGDRLFLLALDTAGNVLWNATWGGAQAESARAVAVAGNGSSIFVAGKSSSVGNGSGDIVLLEHTADGALVSERTWGGAPDDVSHGLAVSGDSVYIVGQTQSRGLGGSDIVLLKVGPGGVPGGPDGPNPPGNPFIAGAVLAVLIIAAAVVAVVVLAARRQ